MIGEKRRSSLWVCIGVGLLCILIQGCAFVIFPGLLEQKGKLEEVVVEKPTNPFVRSRVLIVPIKGIVTGEEQGGLFSHENTVSEIKEMLDKAKDDHRVKAVVLRIDSPGGGVTACDLIYNAVREFKTTTNKPVYAAMMNVAASGGYYVALAADKIYAHPTTVTGSIGVVAVFPEISGLAEKIGIKSRVIKSGDKKDMGSMWRDFTPEEREILEGLIGQMYDRFVDIIAERRPELDRESVLALADGRVYSAQQALDLKLIDGIAYLEKVVEMARDEAGIKEAKVVFYKRPGQYYGNIYERSGWPGMGQVNLVNIDAHGIFRPDEPQFQYLWVP
jgi:protease-4